MNTLQIIDIGVETDNATIFIAYPSDPARIRQSAGDDPGHLRAARSGRRRTGIARVGAFPQPPLA